MSGRPKLVLASASPRRLALLQQIGIDPDYLRPTTVDESPEKGELPRTLARRLARTKCEVALHAIRREPEIDGSLVLAADTVVAVGRRILPKAETLEEASACLRLLSGRSHRVYSAVCVGSSGGRVRERLAETRVRFKRLSREEIDTYLGSGEWRGKAGGYAIQGIAGSFVIKLVGSYTAVVGLPLIEASVMLESAGYPVRLAWSSVAV
ncbi:MAG: Maf-like protein [Rhodobiaceae bacterium]|nr:Maf-like protein [Rhodobiaceae bacterium]MCC0015785.1 Maf-like protein [Rhodobiaceae bacterium]MCC0040570.1 Maf-like protein [Rhodobiaceae bacterium]MCC0054043.1 Maf-like protein [Rhodobiaceae bacterium]